MEAQQVHFVITISSDRCQGHSRCCMLAPELFASDELGFSKIVGDGSVPEELLAKAELAVANCPESAITLNPA